MNQELASKYDPKEVEDRLYAKWESNGYFKAGEDSGQGELFHCDPASECDRSASYGACAG